MIRDANPDPFCLRSASVLERGQRERLTADFGEPFLTGRLKVVDGAGWEIRAAWVDDVEVTTLSLPLSCRPFDVESLRNSTQAGLSVAHSIDLPEGSRVSLEVERVGEVPAQFEGRLSGLWLPPDRLRLSSGDPILPGQRARVAGRVDGVLRPLGLCISSPAQDWQIDEIWIDGRRQFASSEELPGAMFGADSIDTFVSFPPGTEFVLLVRYAGDDPGGRVFLAQFGGRLDSHGAHVSPTSSTVSA